MIHFSTPKTKLDPKLHHNSPPSFNVQDVAAFRPRFRQFLVDWERLESQMIDSLKLSTAPQPKFEQLIPQFDVEPDYPSLSWWRDFLSTVDVFGHLVQAQFYPPPESEPH